MKILVNATTCVVGGGVQVAVAFIFRAINDHRQNIFRFVVSEAVFSNLIYAGIKDDRISVISPSPARPWEGRYSRRQLRAMEIIFKPDVVLTIFGPSYVKFRSPHICGFADPWVTHRSKLAMDQLSLFGKLRTLALCQYKLMRLSRGDWYWVEVEVVRRGLGRLLGISKNRIRIIPNSYAAVFEESRPLFQRNADYFGGSINVLCLAAPYPHKNLNIIPDVASELRRKIPNIEIKFLVTLPLRGREVAELLKKAESLEVTNMIQNVGPVAISDCPRWYAASHIVFLPSLLEAFSANYPEAMFMGKPIVTTDLDFAHEICGDAAAYFAPLSPVDAADAIEEVVTKAAFRETLIENGRKRLSFFPKPDEKYRMMMKWNYEVFELNKCNKSSSKRYSIQTADVL
jgi:glycosyltransferase involved in cell wall biosynthesis